MRCSGTLLVLATLSIVISVVVNLLSKTSRPATLPQYLTSTTNGTLGRILCLNSANAKPEAEKQAFDGKSDGNTDWKLMATLIDRMAFLIYIIVAALTHI